MDERLLRFVAAAEAAFVAITLLVLFGHAAWLARRHRRQDPRLTRVAGALAAALDGHVAERYALDELAGLPPAAQIGLFASVGQSLGGVQKQRLADVAAAIGLLDRAERWCRSRRWGRRLRGARLLTLLGGGEAVVAGLLDDPRPEVRAQAAQWAAEHPEPALVARLLAMLSDAEPLCHFTVKDSLARMGGACADPLLVYIVAAGGAPVPAALEVAAGVADARFLAPALDLCRSSDPRTRALAARLVAAVGGTEATDRLGELLTDPHPDVRAAAAKALGRLAHWPATAALATCLRDPSWEVRRAAAIALKAMGAVGVLLLRRALSDPDRFARDMARQVLELPVEPLDPGYGDREDAHGDPGATLATAP
jgi:HEAT repeat protein